jgi:hypothetical protein
LANLAANPGRSGGISSRMAIVSQMLAPLVMFLIYIGAFRTLRPKTRLVFFLIWWLAWTVIVFDRVPSPSP